MCIGGMRASKPQVYQRPNPQDIYYNGNIYDPKPEPAKEEPTVAMKDKDSDDNKFKPNLLNKSSTGLQIT